MSEERFNAWVSVHLGVLHRIARAFATGVDRQDLLQELLLALWRAAPAFRGESAETTFIYRVAHNRALTWRRGENQRRKRQSDYERLHVEEGAAADPLLDRLYEAVRQLPPLDRSLLLLSLEGQSYAQIASIHGLTESNVGVRLTRSRAKLAQFMETKDGL
ncbi:RNA polymerase sigma factor [Terricaulis sp.]|uniref:RNA polymerase sigma factor n=1 Tax=Terricaulis sp. TaxID=2768686 RepID=UPI002AC5FAA2|nr:sigma-70 family RNA polymerase sigma factor [Terricaulis sp.]MDZ4690725.1 sigma-70 family RNA polymerase sigma factor [Terricaulis sp.]